MKIHPLFLFTLIFIDFNVCAENLLPTYSEFYFDVPSDAIYDSCHDIKINQYHLRDPSPQKIATAYFSSLPVRSDCSWNQGKFDRLDIYPPLFFPGSLSSWQTLIKTTPTTPQTQVWTYSCVDKQGKQITSMELPVYPKYDCPFGTLVSRPKKFLDGKGGSYFECSTTPDICLADVPGRDLGVPFLGSKGHVALGVPFDSESKNVGSYVIEVLDEDTVIQKNTLENFKARTTYWGTKYNVNTHERYVGYDYLPEDEASAIIEAAWQQRYYNPEYHLNSDLCREGKVEELPVFNADSSIWEKQNGIISAYFRCDTFVAYAYNKVLGREKNPCHLIDEDGKPVADNPLHFFQSIKPYIVFKSFLDIRYDMGPFPPPAENTQTDKYYWLEQEATQIIQLAGPTPEQKQKALWSFAQKNKSNPDNWAYLLEKLNSEKATYLIRDMIQEYYHQTDLKTKESLQMAILEAALTWPNQTRSQLEIPFIVEAQQFFIEQLKTESNPRLLKNAVLLASSIIPLKQIRPLLLEAKGRLQSNKPYLLENKNLNGSLILLEKILNGESLESLRAYK